MQCRTFVKEVFSLRVLFVLLAIYILLLLHSLIIGSSLFYAGYNRGQENLELLQGNVMSNNVEGDQEEIAINEMRGKYPSVAEDAGINVPISAAEKDVYQSSLEEESQCIDTGYSKSETRKYPISFLNMTPPTFLNNYRNPCWYEEFPPQFIYSKQVMCEHHKEYFQSAVNLWNKLRANGTRWRLRCLPYFYIAGVTKSGTSELYDKISRHPMVQKCLFKEPQWWNRERMALPVPVGNPLKDYVDLFDYAAAQIEAYTTSDESGNPYHPIITGEASAGTIWLFDNWRNLPENEGYEEPKYVTADYIKHFQPDAKVILTLRNPTSRLYADFYYFHNPNNTSSLDFHHKVTKSVAMVTKCLELVPIRQCLYNTSFFLHSDIPVPAVRRSMYYPYVRDWLQVFSRKQLYVIRLEDYSRNKMQYLNEIYAFLGLDPLPQNTVDGILEAQPANKNRHVRPPLLPQTKTLLDQFYSPYNKLLAELLADERFLWNDS